MSTRELLEIVKSRGLALTLKDGQPVLQRPHGNKDVTDSLLKVLKIHRDRIADHLRREQA